MDRAKALQLFGKLEGNEIDGWRIVAFVDNGKSAAVFRAVSGSSVAAIKVYDDELVSKFGDMVQLERLSRERTLVDHGHPNLVAIHNSGYTDIVNCHYLIMEFLPQNDLSKTIEQVGNENIPALIAQLASAAKFLEDRSYAHRDIKPANIIVVDKGRRLILLDFGVLKPVGEVGITDYGGTPLFVGTNQYASPEFAMRTEQNTVEGWRAVTFYQIGAVLHDLIMKKPLFGASISVPARLAYAVQTEVPNIQSTVVSPYYINLAQNCLIKSPLARLRLISWNSFQEPAAGGNPINEIQERIRLRIETSSIRQQELAAHRTRTRNAASVQFEAEEMIKEALQEAGGAQLPLPRRVAYKQKQLGRIVVVFEPSESHRLPSGLSLAFGVEVLEVTSSLIEISGCFEFATHGENWKPDLLDKIYSGRIISEHTTAALNMYLLGAVEKAQVTATDQSV